MERFDRAAEKCADRIRRSDECLVVSHIDADGLTAAGIICLALKRTGKSYDVRFLKKLDDVTLEDIARKAGRRLVIFTDLGSGAIDRIKELGIDAIVTDHHQPKADFATKSADYEYHMNPHLAGLNGATDISGAGVAFLLSMKLGPNEDLSALAIVGAVGDLQDMRTNALVGVNRKILELGVTKGFIAYEKDLRLFGRQTRPIYKLLQYSSDPYIPGMSGSEGACIAFLEQAGVQVKAENWRRWTDLSREEKTMVISRLFRHCLSRGMPANKVQRLIGETYTLLAEQPGTELRDASEFSTLLNATARYGYSDIGLAVCMGDRDEAYHTARDLLDVHRRNLVSGLNYVSDRGVIRLANMQYFDAKSEIRETIVGIIAGMSTSLDCVTREVPIIGLATSEQGIKVSARGNHDLIVRGLNLARALSEAATAVGGAGGGHDIAAGATIPAGREQEFLALLDSKIGEQINGKA
jgi:RecJ-like exonuclease